MIKSPAPINAGSRTGYASNNAVTWSGVQHKIMLKQDQAMKQPASFNAVIWSRVQHRLML